MFCLEKGSRLETKLRFNLGKLKNKRLIFVSEWALRKRLYLLPDQTFLYDVKSYFLRFLFGIVLITRYSILLYPSDTRKSHDINFICFNVK